jgi:hypothetical protein
MVIAARIHLIGKSEVPFIKFASGKEKRRQKPILEKVPGF